MHLPAGILKQNTDNREELEAEKELQFSCKATVDLELYCKALVCLSDQEISQLLLTSACEPGAVISTARSLLKASHHERVNDIERQVSNVLLRDSILPPLAVARAASLIIELHNLGASAELICNALSSSSTMAGPLLLAFAGDQLRIAMTHHVASSFQKRAQVGPLATKLLSISLTSEASLSSNSQLAVRVIPPSLDMPVFIGVINLGRPSINNSLGKQLAILTQEAVHLQNKHVLHSQSSFVLWFISSNMKADLVRTFYRLGCNLEEEAESWASQVVTLWSTHLPTTELDFSSTEVFTASVDAKLFVLTCWDHYFFEKSLLEIFNVLERADVGLKANLLQKFRITGLDLASPQLVSLI